MTRLPGYRLRVLAVISVLGLLAATIWWPGWYDNYHAVIPGELYRSAQMSASRLQMHLEQDQIHTVINLRPETNELWHVKEAQACQNGGAEYIDVPLVGDRAPTTEQVTKLVTIFRQARRPILIHCEHGADRTGFAVALYLSGISGMNDQQACKALSIRYGHLAFTRVGCFDDAFAQVCRDRHSPVSP